MRRKIPKKKDYIGKIGGLTFLLSILFLFVLGACFLISSITIFLTTGARDGQLGIFLFAMIGTQIILAGLPPGRIRIFIHEVKHALLIAATDNKISDFSVDKHGGHVAYKIDKKDFHYLPLIALAPYCYPLLSLPAFVLCLIFSDSYPIQLSLLLGVTLAFDLNTGIHDIHSEQEDFKKVAGGFLIAGSYIAGWIFFWVNACLLWVIGNNYGFVFSANMLFYSLKNIVI